MNVRRRTRRVPAGRMAAILSGIALALAPIGVLARAVGQSPPSGGVTITKDVTYETVDGLDMPLTVFQPRGSGTYPGVIFIHGGQFQTGDKCQLKTAAAAHELASQGFVVYSIDYRLAPKLGEESTQLRCADGSTTDVSRFQGHLYPAGADDALAALRWVKANGSHYQTDTARISCVGSSAGGTLCYGLGARGLVDAQVGWSGPTKLDEPFARDVVTNYLGCPLTGGDTENESSVALPVALWLAADVLLGLGWFVIRRRRRLY